MNLYKWAMRPALFALDAERAHDLMMATLRQPLVQRALRAGFHPFRRDSLRQRVLGLAFDNPVGLAAGLDKQGTATSTWATLGFGFVEIGTVTPRPQPGNPRPRIFRLPEDLAIINRLGFNSVGANGVARNLAAGAPSTIRLGINVGKNRETPNDRAAEDYLRAVEALHPFADYFVVNVSSPNTSGLRDLQESQTLRTLIQQVVTRVRALKPGTAVPVLVKVSPDMAPDDLVRSVAAAVEGGAAGAIATNTTIARVALKTGPPLAAEAGGLSGAPLRAAANEACRLLYRHLGPGVPIVGVGGVFTADHAYERIRAGASLVQLYTGLIYEGPGVISRILDGLAKRLARDGFSNVREAIGVDVQR
jgi:dihydroorotate dehydrogenase